MTCKCDYGCTTRDELRQRHGTPREFELAVESAYADGYLGQDYAAAHKAFTDYRRMYETAP
jgi:hypothetical protein